MIVPEGYADNFRKTDAVFKYQSVFDPKRKRLVRLNEVSDNDSVTKEDLQFAGPYPLVIYFLFTYLNTTSIQLSDKK